MLDWLRDACHDDHLVDHDVDHVGGLFGCGLRDHCLGLVTGFVLTGGFGFDYTLRCVVGFGLDAGLAATHLFDCFDLSTHAFVTLLTCCLPTGCVYIVSVCFVHLCHVCDRVVRLPVCSACACVGSYIWLSACAMCYLVCALTTRFLTCGRGLAAKWCGGYRGSFMAHGRPLGLVGTLTGMDIIWCVHRLVVMWVLVSSVGLTVSSTYPHDRKNSSIRWFNVSTRLRLSPVVFC